MPLTFKEKQILKNALLVESRFRLGFNANSKRSDFVSIAAKLEVDLDQPNYINIMELSSFNLNINDQDDEYEPVIKISKQEVWVQEKYLKNIKP